MRFFLIQNEIPGLQPLNGELKEEIRFWSKTLKV
jgi:hypothetical protein